MKGIRFYPEDWVFVAPLSMEQRGRVFSACMHFGETQEEPEDLDKLELVAYTVLSKRIRKALKYTMTGHIGGTQTQKHYHELGTNSWARKREIEGARKAE